MKPRITWSVYYKNNFVNLHIAPSDQEKYTVLTLNIETR